MGICCLGSSVLCHRGFRVFCADPPCPCIRCSSCGFGGSTGCNVHADETGGSGSVMMWLTSRPRAPTALGLLSGYPVVLPESGDSVTRRRYPVQRSGRRLGSPRLVALFRCLAHCRTEHRRRCPSPSDGAGTGGARLHRGRNPVSRGSLNVHKLCGLTAAARQPRVSRTARTGQRSGTPLSS
jgi:hypothetical protein